MKTSKKGKEIIKKFEGLRLTSYRCAANVLTIGWGHTNGVTEGMTITQQQAEKMLDEDLKVYENAVNAETISLNQNQFDALVSFSFNVGVNALKTSTLMKKVRINTNDETIRAEFMKWINVGSKLLEGLRKRRNEEANLYFS